ncbi:MAG: hypothetical protein WA948_02795 [Pontixanthobacter sp.]
MVKHVSEYGSGAVDSIRDKTPGRKSKVPGPSTNPATNLVVADITMRAGTYIMRSAIEKGMLRGRYDRNTASEIIKNKTLGQTLISVVLAKMATRSLPGAVVVGGGIAAKTLFDRSQRRRKAKHRGDQSLREQANRD